MVWHHFKTDKQKWLSLVRTLEERDWRREKVEEKSSNNKSSSSGRNGFGVDNVSSDLEA